MSARGGQQGDGKWEAVEKVALICNNLFDLYKFSAWAGSGLSLSLPSRLLFRVQCKNAFYSIFSSRNIDKLLAGIFDSIWGMPLLALSLAFLLLHSREVAANFDAL